MKYLLTPLAFSLLLLTGCTSPEQQVLPEDVRNLENLTVIAADSPDTLELRPRQSYGSTDTVLLGSIGAVTADHQNRVILQDRDTRYIYAYDPDGNIIGRMGGSGRGPGEFSFFAGFDAAIRGSSIYISNGDRSNAYNLQQQEFSHTAMLRPMNQEDFDSLDNHVTAGHHMLTDSTLLMGFRRPDIRASPDQGTKISYHLMDHKGTILSDRILELPDLIFYRTTMDGSPRYSTFSFTPMPKIAVSGEGHIYATRSDRFLIKRYDAEGSYMEDYYYPYERASIDRSRLLEDYDNEMHQKMIRTSTLPESWPTVGALMVDERNRLWVRVIGEQGDQSLWWIIAEDGECLGVFREPEDEGVQAARNGHIYTRKTLENGEQVIQRYSVL